MGTLIKIECCSCGEKYYINEAELEFDLPPDIKAGEAFPNRCPLCGDGRYATLVIEEK